MLVIATPSERWGHRGSQVKFWLGLWISLFWPWSSLVWKHLLTRTHFMTTPKTSAKKGRLQWDGSVFRVFFTMGRNSLGFFRNTGTLIPMSLCEMGRVFSVSGGWLFWLFCIDIPNSQCLLMMSLMDEPEKVGEVQGVWNNYLKFGVLTQTFKPFKAPHPLHSHYP